jgi:hypothetical protein
VPNQLATLVRLYISSVSQGNKQLFHISKIDPKDEAKKTAQTGLGSQRAIGWIQSPGAITITLTSYIAKGKQECDWQFLADSAEEFTLNIEVVGGDRTQYMPCVVSTANPSYDKDGNNVVEVEIVALDKKRL